MEKKVEQNETGRKSRRDETTHEEGGTKGGKMKRRKVE